MNVCVHEVKKTSCTLDRDLVFSVSACDALINLSSGASHIFVSIHGDECLWWSPTFPLKKENPLQLQVWP